MQNRSFLVLLRPIFCEKLKIAPTIGKQPPPQTFEFPNLTEKSDSILVKTFFIFIFIFLETTWFWAEKTFEFRISAKKIRLNFGEDLFFLFFWRPPDFGRKKSLNFRAFREISSQFSDKPCETDSRTMKIRVKVDCTFFHSFRNSPPFPNPGYAPDCVQYWYLYGIAKLFLPLLFCNKNKNNSQ